MENSMVLASIKNFGCVDMEHEVGCVFNILSKSDSN